MVKKDNGDGATKNISTSDLWENIGFHRPVAGFFYNLPFYLITLILGIGFIGFIYKVLYPFPETIGYRATITGLFSLLFYSFDLGTSNLLNRFIGESNIKNPVKMVQYIQYFIWYQAITGLIQTTSISLYAIFFVPQSQISYAVWIMLIYSTCQYPGFLGIFRGTLNTLQQYNKTAILNFIAGEVFQRITEVIFVLLGRWYGANHPETGEIMGIAIGATIGLYLDDFIATAVSAFFFKKVLVNYNLTLKDCFRHDFDKELFKTCFTWGLRSGLPNFFWALEGYITLILWINYVPQYTTFAALAAFGGGIGSMMGWSLDLGGCMSEAFFNGKKKLAQYYLAQAWRYTGLIQSFMFSLIIIVLAILKPVLLLLGMDSYMLAIYFVIPKMVRDAQQPYNNFAETTTTGTGHVNFQMLIDIYEATMAILSMYLFIAVFKIPQTHGVIAIAWIIPCGEMPAIVSKVTFSYIFIHKRILKIKVPIYQGFIAPAIVTSIVYLLGLLHVNFVFYPMQDAFGGWVALITTAIIFILIIPFILYFPLTGFLGAWDDESMDIIEKAVKMSGLGKFFAVPMFKMLSFAVKKSKLHGKFSVDNSEAIKEAIELMEIKNKMRKEKVRIAY
ncbi:MAG: hypothetical protein ACTSVI_01410 [Promethearchaeota archaeon]